MTETITLPPGPDGAWQIGEVPGSNGGAIFIHVQRRPRWLTRLMVRWLFEWRWIDARDFYE